MALLRDGFPVLAFAQHDETRAGVEALAGELAARGADVLLAGAEVARRARAADAARARGRSSRCS